MVHHVLVEGNAAAAKNLRFKLVHVGRLNLNQAVRGGRGPGSGHVRPSGAAIDAVLAYPCDVAELARVPLAAVACGRFGNRYRIPHRETSCRDARNISETGLVLEEHADLDGAEQEDHQKRNGNRHFDDDSASPVPRMRSPAQGTQRAIVVVWDFHSALTRMNLLRCAD